MVALWRRLGLHSSNIPNSIQNIPSVPVWLCTIFKIMFQLLFIPKDKALQGALRRSWFWSLALARSSVFLLLFSSWFPILLQWFWLVFIVLPRHIVGFLTVLFWFVWFSMWFRNCSKAAPTVRASQLELRPPANSTRSRPGVTHTPRHARTQALGWI